MKIIAYTSLTIISIYLIFAIIAYIYQEKGIFHPEKLDKNFKYNFIDPFEELDIVLIDGDTLNSLYFSVPENQKLAVYYHGNAGTLEHWGEIAHIYIEQGFNILIYDYRGFGKSSGEIKNEKHFYEDAQVVYDKAKILSEEKDITVVGYSIGTGAASYIASKNNPERLILKSPYYDLPTLAKEFFMWLPMKWLIKYKFSNRENLEKVKAPVYIFHGENDALIAPHHSKWLYQELQEKPELVILPHQGHNGMNFNELYIEALGLFNEKNLN